MDHDQLEPWNWFQQIALGNLRATRHHDGYWTGLQVIVVPATEEPWSYELLVPPRLLEFTSALAVKTVWRRDLDLKNLPEIVARRKANDGRPLLPTMEQYKTEIDTKQVLDLRDKASLLQMPALPAAGARGKAGTSYQFGLYRHQDAARFEWWGFPPRGWEPLGSLVKEVIALCG